MQRPPRRPTEGVLGGGLWWQVLLAAAVIAVLSLAAALLVGGSAQVQRSAVLLTLGAGSWACASACASGNRPTRSATVLCP